MIISDVVVWILIGVGSAVLYFKYQQWSVNRLNPDRTKQGMREVIGGAVIRWVLIFFVLGLSLSHSLQALLIVFSTFMLSRFLILLKWNGLLQFKNPFIRQP